MGYRLPSEAEWEYAARGGNKQDSFLYSGSNNLDEVGWNGKNSDFDTYPVGQKKANRLGLYDMSGNVCEWCWDWYGAYASSQQVHPLGAATGSSQVFRGGSWTSSADDCTVSYRGHNTPGLTNCNLGFRLQFKVRYLFIR